MAQRTFAPRDCWESVVGCGEKSMGWACEFIGVDRCRKVGWQNTILWGLQLVEMTSKGSFAQMFVRPKIHLKLN